MTQAPIVDQAARNGSAASWRAAFPLARVMPWLAVSVLCVVGLVLRGYLIRHNGGLSHIDENEVVEQAVAFMSGEWRYRFLKYGPLLMYLLAGVYHVLAFVRGMSPLDYASQAFLHGEEHYWVARMSCAVCLAVVAVVSFANLRRSHGLVAALTSCALLALPGVDRLTFGNARIDVLQGTFQVLGLFALSAAATQTQPARRPWLLAGLCAGAAVAAKPIPGLLILPCFLLASWCWAAHATGRELTPRTLALRALRTLRNPGLAWAALTAAVAAAAGNPTMAASPTHFVKEQFAAATLHSSADVPWTHSGPIESMSGLGLPMLIAFAVAIAVVVVRRDVGGTLFALFVATYIGALYGRAARYYYMIPVAMAGCVLIGMAIGAARPLAQRIAARFAPPRLLVYGLMAVAVVALLRFPALELLKRRQEPSAYFMARQWILEHIPNNSGIRYIGRSYVTLHLVAHREKDEGVYGGHFEYGRKKYRFYNEAFKKGYADYRQTGKPTYRIAVERVMATPKAPRNISRWLAKRAREAGQEYVILSGFKGDVRDLRYRWFDQATLEAQFDTIAIFKLKPNS